MSTRFVVEKVPVTGTGGALQTITFATLTDIDKNDLPTTFDSAPLVGVVAKFQDRSAFIEEGSVTTTNFQIAMSDLEGAVSITTGYYNLLIEGDE